MAAACVAAALPSLAWAQGEDDPALRDALEVEGRQVALIQRLSRSVAAVFPGDPGQGGGSGVVMDPRGYVLTNFHVSKLERELWVGLNDGKVYPARLLGFDPGGDISLLKLVDPQRETYQAVPLGESDAARVGEPVYALGNPFLLAEDFTPTVTQGVISGLHRYRDATGSSDLVYGDCIQIDASINPGNSGGPLFNGRGELLGINGLGGFRPDRGRVNVGVGFAASIDQIKNFLLDLRAGRQCYHGTMNATVRDQPAPQGQHTRLVVDAITSTSSAYRAGLRLGDVVRSFAGVEVRTQNRLLTLVSRLPAGRRVTLEVDRAREEGGGMLRLRFSFRLEPLWAGPEQGKWQPDPELVAAETQLLLGGHRAGDPPTEWARAETVQLAGGGAEPRVTRVRGRSIRVERGPPARRVVDVVTPEDAWRQEPDGAVVDLPPERRDHLAGTVEALHALAAAEGEEGLTRLTFTGGEQLGGRPVARLEVRDRAGRKRLLYIDPETHALAGLAYPAGEDWVEVTYVEVGVGVGVGAGGELGPAILRVDFETGEPLETSRDVSFTPAPQDPALFQRPGGGER